MKLKFKIQEFQTEAVESVVEVFAGQPYGGDEDSKYLMDPGKKRDNKLEFEGENEGFGNSEIVLTNQQLLQNINKVQERNKIFLSKEVVHNLGCCQLDIEMETGTGKTYVYIKTMFELNKKYGWTKFIVVVPSVAIREGVKKSFEITADHFMESYEKKADFFIYNSDNLQQIDSFSKQNDISVMIINTQAFNTSMKEGAGNKAARIIYDKRDDFASRRPIDVIAANNPILILDEPQKMGGNATQSALKRFNPLFTLNYSATHKEPHNTIYVLDALDAYNKKLVKKIEVVGFELRNLHGTDSYIYLSDFILSHDKPPMARMEIEVRNASESIKRVTKDFVEGDDLYHISGGLEQYKGFKITEIYIGDLSYVSFDNGIKMYSKDCYGNITAEHKARIQIRETIKAHFKKESDLYSKKIKCLSLFFLDEVANYRKYDENGEQILGRYGEIFEEEYKSILNENRNIFESEYNSYLNGIPVRKTHAGYFSIDKKSGRSINSELKRGSDISDDTSAYDLIMKNKEQLLSLEEPVRFIFSHSALREGWDNPNVFQICSLRQSNSVTQKRQEVGRGLRLSVDGSGERQDFDRLETEVHSINKLTVVASEAYATFAKDLQKEIRADLYDRPTKADSFYFNGKKVKDSNGKEHTITQGEAQEIYIQLRELKYIDKNGEITPTFNEAAESGYLAPLTEELAPYSDQIYNLVMAIRDPSVLDNMIEDASKPEYNNKLNENFYKKEFQNLWKEINHKYVYTVRFESKELIGKAIEAIDKKLSVSRLMYNITRGEQKAELKHDDMKEGEMLTQVENKTEVLKTDVVSEVKYDLLGEIAKKTKLTRKTIAEILGGIRSEKFEMFKQNPEEFIREVARLINEQKATIIVDHISYNAIEGTYDSSIFTQEKHTSIDKAYKGEKHILDYVFTDGTAEKSIEREFVEELDKANEVVVYAKLPKGFHIPTPVGNYSPDWAIAFDENEVKHIYFIAETKGSMSSMELRGIEKCKTECADKLFHQLSNGKVMYSVVDDYSHLINLVK